MRTPLDNLRVSAKSPRNFRAYAAIEAFNIFLLPGAALLLAPPSHTVELIAMVLAVGACAGFLLVGAVYWAALGQRLRRADRSSLNRALAFANRLEFPLLLLTGAATAALLYAVLVRGFTWPVLAAAALTLLAALEYVNYYHWQLQHFDRWSDFKRLVRTRRLRPSHMARSLAAHRTKRYNSSGVLLG
jgi:hypothetical protein